MPSTSSLLVLAACKPLAVTVPHSRYVIARRSTFKCRSKVPILILGDPTSSSRITTAAVLPQAGCFLSRSLQQAAYIGGSESVHSLPHHHHASCRRELRVRLRLEGPWLLGRDEVNTVCAGLVRYWIISPPLCDACQGFCVLPECVSCTGAGRVVFGWNYPRQSAAERAIHGVRSCSCVYRNRLHDVVIR